MSTVGVPASAVNFDTQHSDMIHDAQLDYYGRRLATCSSDRTIRVFDVHEDRHDLKAELKKHEGPVWQVAWSHPRHGALLASCSYDRRILVWKEDGEHGWTVIHTVEHKSSVNSISWAPHEMGLILAGASSDKTISITRFKDDKWETQIVDEADSLGCNSVSWAPAFNPQSLFRTTDDPESSARLRPRFASAGCDGSLRIWSFSAEGRWTTDATLPTLHDDWIRDVAWAPNPGLPLDTIATASQDRTVWIVTRSHINNTNNTNNNNTSSSSSLGDEGSEWQRTRLAEFPAPVWRVSWSLNGSLLAVTTGDNKVTLWKQQQQQAEGGGMEWKQLTTLKDLNSGSGSGSNK